MLESKKRKESGVMAPQTMKEILAGIEPRASFADVNMGEVVMSEEVVIVDVSTAPAVELTGASPY